MSIFQCIIRSRHRALRDSATLLVSPQFKLFPRVGILACHRHYASLRRHRSAFVERAAQLDNVEAQYKSQQDLSDSEDRGSTKKHESGAFAAEMRSLVDPGHNLREKTPLELDITQAASTRKHYPSPGSLQAENLAMVDYYDEPRLASEDDIQARGHEMVLSDSTNLETGTDDSSEASLSQRNAIVNARLLSRGLRTRILSRQLAYELYRKLPSPGVAYLKPRDQHLLLVKMSQVYVTERNEQAMMQYLSVFDDLHTAGITPKMWQWAAAMHLTGRYVKKVTISELENAMRIWKRMEEGAGIRSNIITMNILLDIALKSRHLDLADLLIDEIRQRDLTFDRFTYLSIIHLHGLRGNGDGIRKTYRDMVTANEVVDSMALTCVVAAFLQAGELAAAMNVYRRMQARSFPAKDVQESTARTAWDLGRLIAKFTRHHGQDPKMLEDIQGEISVRPNIITYVNLIGHHATRTGELLQIVGLLDEMSAANVPIHGAVFTELFNGFARHGGTMFTSWTKDRLEEVWAAFKNLADAGVKDVFVGPVIALAVLEAFKECSGKARALEIIDELRIRWRKRDESHVFDEEWLKYEVGLRSRRVTPWTSRAQLR